MPHGIVYVARHADGRVYVGSTKRSLAIRIARHYNTADASRNYTSRSKWLQVLLDTEFQPATLTWSVLEHLDYDSRDELYCREGWWIKHLNAITDGFNSNQTKGSKSTVPYISKKDQPRILLCNAHATAEMHLAIKHVCTAIGLDNCEDTGQLVTRTHLAAAEPLLYILRPHMKEVFQLRLQGKDIKRNPDTRALDLVNLIFRAWNGMELLRTTRIRKRMEGKQVNIDDFQLQPVTFRRRC